MNSEAMGRKIGDWKIGDSHLFIDAHDKVLRVARTFADLESADTITEHHIAVAIQYRSLDRQMF